MKVLGSIALAICLIAGTAQAQIIHNEAPAEEQQQPSQNQTPAAAPKSCAVVTVTASDKHPNGFNWDWPVAGVKSRPDILVMELNTGQQKECRDGFTCTARFTGISGSLSLKLYDADERRTDQLMGDGSCAMGKTCKFSSATVSVGSC